MFRWILPVLLCAGCHRGRPTSQAAPTPGTAAIPLAMEMAPPARPPATEVDPVVGDPLPPIEPFTGTLTFVEGSTEKADTLIGDVDRETGEPTLSLTETRYGITGSDLGYSFEHDGKAWFVFGDTMGTRAGDPIATTTATAGDEGVRLDFLTDREGQYLRVRPPGVSMGGFEVPVSGIGLDGKVYVVVSTNHTRGREEDISVLTRFDEATGEFTRLRDLSALPQGHFLNLSMRLQPGHMDGLPAGGPWVLMWGTGKHRESDAWLSIVPAATFETGEGTLYWTGDVERWSADERDAVPVVEHPTMGDLSVTWVADLGAWLMVYDSRDPRGVLVRWSATPWGPWSEHQTIFQRADGLGRFIHEPGEDDGLAGPMIGGGDRDPMDEGGGNYAPYVVERFTRVEEGVLSFWYTMSTWNPYLVVLMRSDLAISEQAVPSP